MKRPQALRSAWVLFVVLAGLIIVIFVVLALTLR